MTDDALRDLAVAAGLAPRWTDNDNVEQTVGLDTLRAALVALGYSAGSSADIADSRARISDEQREPPALVAVTAGEAAVVAGLAPKNAFARIEFEQGGALDFPVATAAGGLRLPPLRRIGYHLLLVDRREIVVAVAPPRAFTFADAGGGTKMFGLAAQIYALRGKDDDGAGHFGAVADLAEAAARHGADVLALSPAHALFLADDNHFTPYSPSSRLFLNALYADPAAAFGEERLASLDPSLRGAQRRSNPSTGPSASSVDGLPSRPCGPPRNDGDDLIDWPAVARSRIAALRALYESFRTTDLAQQTALAQDFARFRRGGGQTLEDHAIFETLHAKNFGADFTKWHWRGWPAPFRDARSPEVAAFARENTDEVSFHVFAQWLADRSLTRAQGRAHAAGMRIGLVSDLAVGMNPGGSHAWSRPDDLLLGLSIGAPPDALAPLGQNWGLTGFSPRALRKTGYAPFIATLRAALRNAGGVRIDHVLGLVRLWLTPDGAKATDGVYLSMPSDDLLALVRLESVRHRAIVLGEDLGTVPHGLREKLAAAGVAGLRVFLFERDAHRFHPPDWYPSSSVAMTTTHDTSTLAGWWTGRDLEVREATGQLPVGRTRERCEEERARERDMAGRAFADQGLAVGEAPAPDAPQPVVDEAIAYVARTPADMVVAPLEDVLGQVEQPNLPGTTTEHPNWRRRYAATAAALLDAPGVAARVAMLAKRRD